MNTRTFFYTFVLLVSIQPAISQNFTLFGNAVKGENDDQRLGTDVAIAKDGKTMIVGAIKHPGGGDQRGQVTVYTFDGIWKPMGQSFYGQADMERLGYAVDISDDGQIIAIGSQNHPGSGISRGRTRIYQWEENRWTQMGPDINGEADYDFSGACIALSGDGESIIIGAHSSDIGGPNRGYARIFSWNSNSSKWEQLGSNISGVSDHDDCGCGVAISKDGQTIITSSPGNDDNGNNSGYTRVYYWDNNVWNQKGTPLSSGNADDRSGWAVKLSENGNTLAFGAFGFDGSGNNRGLVRIYEWNGNAWVQKGQDLTGTADSDEFGYSLSLSGDARRIAIGAPFAAGDGSYKGMVSIYSWDTISLKWSQNPQIILGENANDENGLGLQFSADGKFLAIGSPGNKGDGAPTAKRGQVRVFSEQSSGWTDPMNNGIAFFMAYPNPASDQITLKSLVSHNTFGTITLYDSKGVKIKDLLSGTPELSGDVITIDLTSFTSGVYILKCFDPMGLTQIPLIITR